MVRKEIKSDFEIWLSNEWKKRPWLVIILMIVLPLLLIGLFLLFLKQLDKKGGAL